MNRYVEEESEAATEVVDKVKVLFDNNDIATAILAAGILVAAELSCLTTQLHNSLPIVGNCNRRG